MTRRMASVGRVTVSDRRSISSPTQHLRDEEGELERLAGVQPGVAGRLVPAVEVLVADLHRAAEALGDVLTGELDVDATGPGAQRPVDVEEAQHLVDDAVEVAGLVAGRGLVGVAVHRVALPHDLVAAGGDLLDDGRQDVADLAVAHPADQRQPAREPSGSRRSTSSVACSGVVVGPILTPMGLAIFETNSMCAPSICRVRSPTQTKCADDA